MDYKNKSVLFISKDSSAIKWKNCLVSWWVIRTHLSTEKRSDVLAISNQILNSMWTHTKENFESCVCNTHKLNINTSVLSAYVYDCVPIFQSNMFLPSNDKVFNALAFCYNHFVKVAHLVIYVCFYGNFRLFVLNKPNVVPVLCCMETVPLHTETMT